jgi:16S rRNA (uracil1498-N3)-methyltransferase
MCSSLSTRNENEGPIPNLYLIGIIGSGLEARDRLPDRFFHSALIDQDCVALDGAEAHHLIHVLRAKPGLEVTLFDGSGAEFLARIERVERSIVRLTILERRPVDRELSVQITLGVAMPKGDRQRWLVEKATELGVACLTPLITERGIAQPSGEALRRFERTVIEASKQCGRNRLMQIAAPVRWRDFVAGVGGQGPEARKGEMTEPPGLSARFFAHPGGATSMADIADELREARQIVLAVGPEGGFTNAEWQQALDASWRAIDLGPRILRVETAALAMVAACCRS